MSTRQNITAIIYDKRGRVLSLGVNSYVKTHPLQALHAEQTGNVHKHFLHAEIHAITRCRDLSKAHKMVVFRYNAAGKPAMAKPCCICQAALATTPIKHVEWTVS